MSYLTQTIRYTILFTSILGVTTTINGVLKT